jgi:hypothetical protein
MLFAKFLDCESSQNFNVCIEDSPSIKLIWKYVIVFFYLYHQIINMRQIKEILEQFKTIVK